MVFPRPKTTKKIMNIVFKVVKFHFEKFEDNLINEESADRESYHKMDILFAQVFRTYEEAYTALENCPFVGGVQIVKIFIQTKTSK